jgi:hypothetical protein
MQALDQIEAALVQWLPLAAEPGPAAPAAEGDLAAEKRPLAVLDERLAELQACLDRAERHAAEAEALLTAEVQALEDWLVALAAARQTLDRAAAPAG